MNRRSFLAGAAGAALVPAAALAKPLEASGAFRVAAEASPSGGIARTALSVSTAGPAGIYLEAEAVGPSRVIFDASKFFVRRLDDRYAELVPMPVPA